jgi:hypothetical protein
LNFHAGERVTSKQVRHGLDALFEGHALLQGGIQAGKVGRILSF